MHMAYSVCIAYRVLISRFGKRELIVLLLNHVSIDILSRVMRKHVSFEYAKTKVHISWQLISDIVFFTKLIVRSFNFLNPKFQASKHLQWLCRLVCVGSGWKPEDMFSHDEAHTFVYRRTDKVII